MPTPNPKTKGGKMKYTDEDVRALVDAVSAYKHERENPVPDYGHRATLLKFLFETLEPFKENHAHEQS